jgi:putative membrane protein
MEIHWVSILNAAVYSILGIILFVGSFIIIDKMTPYHLWDEIVHNKNLALAVLLGSMSIGIGMIIASAVH